MVKRYAVYSKKEYNDLLKKLEKEGYLINGYDSIWEEDFYEKMGVLTVEIYKNTKTIYLHKGTSSHDALWKCGMKLFDNDLEDDDNNYLTTDEFIKAVEELGYRVSVTWNTINIKGDNGAFIAVVKMKEMYMINNYTNEFMDLEDSERRKLFNLISKYITTPIEKREKKYNLKLTGAFDKFDDNYLNFDVKNGYLFFGNPKETEGFEVSFTKREAERLKQIVINNLEIIEVE